MTAVAPGAESQPFVNFHDILASLSHSQQVAAVGAANYRLIESGLVKFADVVTSTRVRPFFEVLAREKLTLKEILKSGVSKHVAEKAYATVHTPAIELARKHANDLIERITATGISRQQVNQVVGKHFAGKVGIKAGPSGASKAVITPTDIRTLVEGLTTVQQTTVAKAALRKGPPPKPIVTTPARHPNPNVSQAIEIIESENIPTSVRDAKYWTSVAGDKAANTPLAYVAESNVVAVNPDAALWTDLDIAVRAGESGFTSSSDPFHFAHHEVGHFKHRNNIGETAYIAIPRDQTMPEAMAKQVSIYSRTNPVEFVAEVYAGMKAGKIYPADIMAEFDRLGGVKPTR